MPNITVEGIVAQRNGEPYVVLKIHPEQKGKGLQMPPIRIQLSCQEARSIANDLYLLASRTEMDACLVDFLKSGETEFPTEIIGAMMLHFREYRAKLDQGNKIETFISEPTES